MNTNGSRASSTRPLSRIAQTAFPVRERLIPVLWPSAGGEFEARDRWGVVSSVIGEHLPLDDRDGCHDEEQDHRHGAGIAHLEVLETGLVQAHHDGGGGARSEEHTSELQSRGHLVCRLLLEKK